MFGVDESSDSVRKNQGLDPHKLHQALSIPSQSRVDNDRFNPQRHQKLKIENLLFEQFYSTGQKEDKSEPILSATSEFRGSRR